MESGDSEQPGDDRPQGLLYKAHPRGTSPSPQTLELHGPERPGCSLPCCLLRLRRAAQSEGNPEEPLSPRLADGPSIASQAGPWCGSLLLPRLARASAQARHAACFCRMAPFAFPEVWFLAARTANRPHGVRVGTWLLCVWSLEFWSTLHRFDRQHHRHHQHQRHQQHQ